MATTLTDGCVLALFQEEEPSAPIVQVINHKAVLNPNTGQERYRSVPSCALKKLGVGRLSAHQVAFGC